MEEALSFEDVAQFEAWLDGNHERPEGAWLKVRKASSAQKAITAPEAGDAALCFGWIDSIRRSLDGDFFLQKYGPRKRKSSWSQVNVERVEALIAAGRMRPPGFAEINAAKEDGRWDVAYVRQKDATTPPDLEAALKANPAAKHTFDNLGKTGQYLVILPLLKALTPKARATRLQKAIESLAAGTGNEPQAS